MLLELKVKIFEQKGADCNLFESTFLMTPFNQPMFGADDPALGYCEPDLIFSVKAR